MTMHTTILRAALLSGLIAATLLAQTASKQNNANRNGDPATSGDSKTSSALEQSSRFGSTRDPLVRLGNLIKVRGVRDNILSGQGLVVGLKGTGDGTVAARQSLVNYLQRMGRKVSSAELASGNIALVQISATLPPFAHHGTKIDVDVASIGEASSLRGGRLVLSELRGPDGKIYALASGSLVIGGFEASGAAAKTTKGVPTFGSIPGGAVCEPPVEELQTRLLNDAGDLELMLPALSSRSIVDARDAIQTMLAKAGIGFCSIAGPNLLRVSLDDAHQRRDKLLGVLANIEDLHIRPDPRSRIDINERTGVVVIGKGVRLSPCLLAVDDLTITVIEDERVSQPGNIGSEEAPGETVVTPQTTIIREQDNRQATLGGEANLQDLLTALRALGLKGQQLIPVLKELHRSGNLHGEMVSR